MAMNIFHKRKHKKKRIEISQFFTIEQEIPKVFKVISVHCMTIKKQDFTPDGGLKNLTRRNISVK